MRDRRIRANADKIRDQAINLHPYLTSGDRTHTDIVDFPMFPLKQRGPTMMSFSTRNGRRPRPPLSIISEKAPRIRNRARRLSRSCRRTRSCIQRAERRAFGSNQILTITRLGLLPRGENRLVLPNGAAAVPRSSLLHPSLPRVVVPRCRINQITLLKSNLPSAYVQSIRVPRRPSEI